MMRSGAHYVTGIELQKPTRATCPGRHAYRQKICHWRSRRPALRRLNWPQGGTSGSTSIMPIATCTKEAEDAATRAAWQKLRKFERRPQYQASPDRAITVPVFEASPAQRENMLALLHLLQATCEKVDLEQVELHRELGQFDEAARALQETQEEKNPACTY